MRSGGEWRGAIAPSWPLPHIQPHSTATSLTPPRGTLTAPSLKVTDAQGKKKKMAQMTEHFKAPEKIQLSEEEIANLSYAQFKTLVIRILTEMADYGHKMEEKNVGYAK